MKAEPGGAEEVTALPVPTTTLETIATDALLRTVWKRTIRPALRTGTFSSFYLATDAVQYAGYEWGLSSLLVRLQDELKGGTYSPDAADIVRGAKSRGLSRPLAYLSPRDALVYAAIVSRTIGDLKRDLRPWTGAFQVDKEKLSKALAKTVEEEPRTNVSVGSKVDQASHITYGNFFDMWLKKQGVVHHILSETSFIVESDIANYFASIDLRIVDEMMYRSCLHRDVVRLLSFLLRSILRHPQYAGSPGLGLPQDSVDSSRHIAHGLLSEVDAEFDTEGAAGLYGRFMDDFALGVNSEYEGERAIARLQRRLETLGLYPNPSKTRIYTVEEYRKRIMLDENAYLEEVQAKAEMSATGKFRQQVLPLDVIEGIQRHAQSMRKLVEQPARYDRILRRYYLVMRELGLSDWLSFVLTDLKRFPDSAPHLLEYVRSFPLNESLVPDLFETCLKSAHLYGNIPLLILETLATVPNDDPEGLRPLIRDGLTLVAQEMLKSKPTPRSSADWVLAFCAPLAAKWLDPDERASWVDLLSLDKMAVQSVVRLHALPMRIGDGASSKSLFASEMAGLPWSGALTLDYIRALEDNEAHAVNVAIGLVDPVIRLRPNRFMMHTRAISLLRIIRRNQNERIERLVSAAAKRLESNPKRLMDHRGLQILSDPAGAGA